MQIVERELQHVLRRVEERHAAVRKVRDHLRLEEHVEAIDRRVRHAGTDGVDVVGESVHVAHVGNRIAVAGVRRGDHGEDVRVQVLPVGELVAVERLIDAGLDLPREIIGRGGHHVVAGIAGEQLRLELLVRIVGVVDDPDAGLSLEVSDRVLADVVGPVVDIQHSPAGGVARGGRTAGRQGEDRGKEYGRDAHGKPFSRRAYSLTMMWRATV